MARRIAFRLCGSTWGESTAWLGGAAADMGSPIVREGGWAVHTYELVGNAKDPDVGRQGFAPEDSTTPEDGSRELGARHAGCGTPPPPGGSAGAGGPPPAVRRGLRSRPSSRARPGSAGCP